MSPDPPMNLHVVEPTLSDETGHCQSFVASLCGAARSQDVTFTVWGGRRAFLPASVGGKIRLQRFFHRRIRRLQEFFLLRRLLGNEERIFISTAGRFDMVLLNWAASGSIRSRQVFLFFHWVRLNDSKRSFFTRMAARHPELVVMGPTQSVVDVFTGCGFKNCMVVPYPITPRHKGEDSAQSFRHLLFAGAARQDKGFHHVVELVALLAEQGEKLPVALQTSGDHHNKHDAPVQKALARLESIGYGALRLTPQTLSGEAYFEMFKGAICLQPYDPADFADRISGVSLDGLSMGAPLVTLAGTWMARVVERFDAGVVVTAPLPELLLDAVHAVVSDYERYHRNALRAGMVLQQEHNAGHLLEILTA